MGKASREKGKRGELELAKLLAPAFPDHDVQRCYSQSRSGSDAPDVDGQAKPLPFWAEVKRCEAERPRAAYEQAQAATDGRYPAVFWRRSNKPWLVTLGLEDFLRLVTNQQGENDGGTSGKE